MDVVSIIVVVKLTKVVRHWLRKKEDLFMEISTIELVTLIVK